MAIPVLRKVLEKGPSPDTEVRTSYSAYPSDAAVVALFHLDPGGKELAEAWVERSRSPERKAIVLGAMGCTSLEGELLARIWLADLNRAMAGAASEGEEARFVQEWFERLGTLGVGYRGIPRLRELLEHRNPFIRQWARETIERINRPDAHGG